MTNTSFEVLGRAGETTSGPRSAARWLWLDVQPEVDWVRRVWR